MHQQLVSRAPGVRVTLRALVAPRRLIPMILVAVPLLVAQAAYSESRLAVPLAAAMCLAFILVAPVSWRLLFHEPADLPRSIVLWTLYATTGVGVVSALGLVLPRWLQLAPMLLTQQHNLVVCVALFFVGGWGLGRDIALEERLRHREAEVGELAQRAAQAQLLALRAHLDPHFLFNTLNAIAEWCVLDGLVAERAVLELSRMLRTILTGVRARSWSLREVLALVATLCALHRLRDPALFHLRCDIAEDAQATQLPPMLLLPLSENAIKHGPGAGHRGEIAMEVRRTEDRIWISLCNPGPYAGPRAGSDGIPTVEKRLQLAYPDRASFRIAALGVARTVVELELPFELSPEVAA